MFVCLARKEEKQNQTQRIPSFVHDQLLGSVLEYEQHVFALAYVQIRNSERKREREREGGGVSESTSI
jgi:hypothetical protein